MEDINEAIGSILSDPQKMEQLRAVAQSLGLGPPADAAEPAADTAPAVPAPQPAPSAAAPAASGSGIDPAAIASIMQNLQKMQSTFGNSAATGASAAPAQGAQPNLSALTQIAQVMEAMNQEDHNTELLRALKPHFSEARATRIDDAIRVMQLMRAWPVLRESGLLGSIGDMLGGGLGNILGGGRR